MSTYRGHPSLAMSAWSRSRRSPGHTTSTPTSTPPLSALRRSTPTRATRPAWCETLKTSGSDPSGRKNTGLEPGGARVGVAAEKGMRSVDEMAWRLSSAEPSASLASLTK
ncbi:hypothetical protein VCV18_003817 [Metarhizium anisopliae]